MSINNKILIVTSRFYSDISTNLEKEAILTINEHGLIYDIIDVPGAFEVPAVISHAAKSGDYLGYIALGCVIRGETSHYDYVCKESARALMHLSLQGLPIGYGILTCENQEQALKRSTKEGLNKGKAATLACLRMIEVIKEAK